MSGRREEWSVCVGGGRSGVCVGGVGWGGVEGGGEETETLRVCLADAARQTECRLKSEFLQ